MKRGLIKGIIAVIAVMILIGMLSGFIIDYQWFSEVGYLGVFLTSLKAHIVIFIPSLIILFIIIFLYARYLRNSYAKNNNIVFEKAQLKTQNKIICAASAVIGFLVSIMFTGGFWYSILEFFNASDFNIKDPLFGYDAGFYIFKMPLIQGAVGVLISIIVILVIATLVFYSMIKTRDGVISLRGYLKGNESPLARFVAKQLAIFGAVFLLLLSGSFYLKALNLVYSPRGVAVGASYTDVHVTLPMFKIIAVLCLAAAVIVAYCIIKKKVKTIILTTVCIIVLIVSETLISAVVERFIVTPNARDKEMPYLTYNIDFTRKAFGLDKIVEKEFPVDNQLTQKDIQDNKGTIDNIRINEFSQALDVYNQVQAIRNYYKFNDVDIDRYMINTSLRQMFIAARELDNSNREARFQTWQNKHIFYTHGYGAVMSYTNTVSTSGLPEFTLKDIPPSGGTVKVDRPEVYFGEVNDEFIIVDAKSNEIDYPTGNENKETRYQGTAGIKLNLFNRALFAINKGDINFLLSNDITSNSKIILNRSVVNRVKKIAPFIQYDGDPYLVASEGKLYWIIDAYTVTNKFPFSEIYQGVNYVRNSVKVVVDAYNGKVDFYVSDSSDGIASTIGKIYTGLFKDISKLPEDLKKHLRYSEDVFMLQSRVYEKYHMNSPAVFYNSEDLWSIAKYKDTDQSEKEVQAVYQVMRLPGENNEEFLLTIPFTVAKKQNMVSWLAVRMDNNISEKVLVKFPKDKSIYGPQQFDSKLNTDTYISSQRTLWGQQGSKVILGETNIIPIDKSLIYVKPLYIVSSTGKSLPELKKVVVGYGDKIVMEDNIQQAFIKLFNTNVAPAAPAPAQPQPGTQDTVSSLVNTASDLFTKASEAQKSGDWAAYGQYLKELEDTLKKLKEIAK